MSKKKDNKIDDFQEQLRLGRKRSCDRMEALKQLFDLLYRVDQAFQAETECHVAIQIDGVMFKQTKTAHELRELLENDEITTTRLSIELTFLDSGDYLPLWGIHWDSDEIYPISIDAKTSIISCHYFESLYAEFKLLLESAYTGYLLEKLLRRNSKPK